MELDVFVPDLNLAFEYQGQQHYIQSQVYGINFTFSRSNIIPSAPLKQRSKMDIEKEEACKQIGIRLLHVPFWWDGKEESLAKIMSQAQQTQI